MEAQSLGETSAVKTEESVLEAETQQQKEGQEQTSIPLLQLLQQLLK